MGVGEKGTKLFSKNKEVDINLMLNNIERNSTIILLCLSHNFMMFPGRKILYIIIKREMLTIRCPLRIIYCVVPNKKFI